MTLTTRQRQILMMLKREGTLTGEFIADRLNVSKSGLRTDFSTLIQRGYIESKPKVGYKLIIDPFADAEKKLVTAPYMVKEVMQVPLVVDTSCSVQEAIIMMFLENVGSILVLQDGFLAGIISRKDFVKAAMGGSDLNRLPVGMVMTRMPNVFVARPDESTVVAAKRIIEHQVDSLPVVEWVNTDKGLKAKVLGKFSKTTIAKLYAELNNALEGDYEE